MTGLDTWCHWSNWSRLRVKSLIEHCHHIILSLVSLDLHVWCRRMSHVLVWQLGRWP
uniref:Uncharacterized protein n=1 Tax=Arundo donax TaxID=35708 RepID=A0A0A8YN44_ARUDO